jgi:hypothetical protein
MRHMVLAMFMALGLAFTGVSAASAAPIGKAAGEPGIGSTITQVQYAGYCARLKYKCENKYEIGQEGRGNCHRYRVECGRANYCEKLRQACRYKHERGEQGEGNCRRWRYECGA